MLSGDTCRASGCVLDKDDLLIAEHLLPRDLSISATMAATIGAEQKDVKLTDQTISTRDKLKAGDEVLLYRINEDKYVIIEKVVSM